MRTCSLLARCAALIGAAMFLSLKTATAKTPFDDAVAVWQMADVNDSAGKNSRLRVEGDVRLGVALKGEEREASLRRGGDGNAAEFRGGYLVAGDGADGELNLKGKAMTLCVRFLDPSGKWDGPIFSKHGGQEQLVYNLFSGEGGKFIGFELGSEGVQGMRQLRAEMAEIGHAGWHDAIVRYDGRAVELFVDGRLRDEYLAADPLRQGNTTPCMIGAEMIGGKVHNGFRGMIDHAALWSRALTDGEIAGLSGVEKLQYPDIYRENYRPQFHFTARRHWMNDPNGLVYYKGEYHLYFQYMPPGRDGAYKDWGHAVSTDLVHWKQLPTALSPNAKWGGCWSGSAVVDAQNTAGFVLAAAGTAQESPIVAIVTLGGRQANSQCIAYSTDRGRSFTWYDGNPVVGHIVAANRDPKVIWHAPTKRWIMVFYLDGDQFAMFSSPDLKKWTRLGTVRVPGSGECPDFFELPVDGNRANTKWVFSPANGKYWIGSFDGREFKPEGKLQQADYGANFYAAQTFSDIPAADGRRIQIGWMAGGNYPGMPFTQQQSFPCTLTLRTTPDGIHLYREPVKEIATLRDKTLRWEKLALRPGENPLAALSGDLWEIEALIEPRDAASIAFDIRGFKVEYDVKQGKLVALGKSASLPQENGRIKLHLLVDRTSVEVFGNDGRLSMSSCFVPKVENQSLGLSSVGGTANVVSLVVHRLKSAW